MQHQNKAASPQQCTQAKRSEERSLLIARQAAAQQLRVSKRENEIEMLLDHEGPYHTNACRKPCWITMNEVRIIVEVSESREDAQPCCATHRGKKRHHETR